MKMGGERSGRPVYNHIDFNFNLFFDALGNIFGKSSQFNRLKYQTQKQTFLYIKKIHHILGSKTATKSKFKRINFYLKMIIAKDVCKIIGKM